MLKAIINVLVFPIDYLLDFDLFNKVQAKVFNAIGLVVIAFLLTVSIFLFTILV